jgi:hypothetical protein
MGPLRITTHGIHRSLFTHFREHTLNPLFLQEGRNYITVSISVNTFNWILLFYQKISHGIHRSLLLISEHIHLGAIMAFPGITVNVLIPFTYLNKYMLFYQSYTHGEFFPVSCSLISENILGGHYGLSWIYD